MKIFVGIASYARPTAFKLSLLSLLRTQEMDGIIAVIDVNSQRERELYLEALSHVRERSVEVILDISERRRGFVNARNRVLDLADETLKADDVLVLFDDDYVYPNKESLHAALVRLYENGDVGVVAGRVVDLRKRSFDPDFYLNVLPGLTDILFKLTGFVFLDTKHGPRYTYFTPPLRALRAKVVKQGVRFDPKFGGTGYRSEDDFNLQVIRLGYKIVFEPRFWVYHLGLEYGGCRTESLAERFYWKSRNNACFLKKHRLGLLKLALSTSIILAYSLLNGSESAKFALEGFVDCLSAELTTNNTELKVVLS